MISAERGADMPKANAGPHENVQFYEKLLALFPDVERKGATHPYTSVNGNMFSCLHPDGVLSLRLGPEEREAFLKRYKTQLFEAYGIVQKEYVTVPEKLLKKTDELRPYFAASLRYARGLKTKATKK